jgi:hypothetical protein
MSASCQEIEEKGMMSVMMSGSQHQHNKTTRQSNSNLN